MPNSELDILAMLYTSNILYVLVLNLFTRNISKNVPITIDDETSKLKLLNK